MLQLSFWIGNSIPGLFSLRGAKVTLVAETIITCRVCIIGGRVSGIDPVLAVGPRAGGYRLYHKRRAGE